MIRRARSVLLITWFFHRELLVNMNKTALPSRSLQPKTEHVIYDEFVIHFNSKYVLTVSQ